MNYVNMVKSIVKTGQSYLASYGKTKGIKKVNKSQVVQDAKCFNDNQIDPRKCQKIITDLIYLLVQGQQFAQDEAIQLFFSITKLFKSPSSDLRRMVYQIIKEMRSQSSIYIVTSCLVKDIQDKDNFFKMNALRTIHFVLDPSNLVQIQRYIKTLIANDNPGVSCSALLSGIQLFSQHQQMVKKWSIEVSEKLNSKEQATKFHALILLSQIKKKDKVSFKKVLDNLMKENLSELATIQLIRILGQYIEDMEHSSPEAAATINYISKQVRSTHSSVVFEAAKLACQSSLLSNKQLLDIIKILESLLVTSNTVKRFGVLKLYNKLLKNTSRKSLMVNISEVEKVLSDKNRSLSSLAASILLRMCNESQLEKLFNQISSSMSEMSDDYKIDVMGSIKNVIKQFPAKYKLINEFLVKFMQQEKKYEFSKAAVDVMEYEIRQIGGEAKKDCLNILAQSLFVLNFQKIHFQILGVISRQVNSGDIEDELLKNLIAQIYLQDAPVRACSLSTLVKLSAFDTPHRQSINRVINQFSHDEDEEVRFRAIVQTPQETTTTAELDILQAYLQQNILTLQNSNDRNALSWDSVKAWVEQVGIEKIINVQDDEDTKGTSKVQIDEQKKYRETFNMHSTFSKYGPMLKVCPPILLTEKQAQFQVNLRKFFFKEHIILEYTVENHLGSAVLQDVKIELKHNSEDLKIIHMIPAKEIKTNTASDIFLGLSINSEESFPTASFTSLMKYRVKETQGGKTAQYDDEYQLEDFNLNFTDFMTPRHIAKGSFMTEWEEFKIKEQVGNFQLNYPNTQAAAKIIQKHFGLAVSEAQQDEASLKTNLNTFYLSGTYLSKDRVLMICMIGYDTKKGCLMKIRVKCSNEEISQSILNSIE